MSQALSLHRHPDADGWADATASLIADHLVPGQRLLLSGGGTPAPVYRRLAEAALDWQQLQIGLVDERWLERGDDNRNDLLIARQLLAHQPLARFFPLIQPGGDMQASVAAANHWWQAGPPPAVAVLGMGNDGHTASLFPGAVNLAQAVASEQAYAAIDARGCPGAQQFPQRISLTPSGLSSCTLRLLLLRGQDKLDTFNQALESGDAKRFPVLHALNGASPLQVHWCA